MRKHLLSFDKFHEQKNLDYFRLLNQINASRSKTSAKNRHLHRKFPTQGNDDTQKLSLSPCKGQTHFLSTFLQKDPQPIKTLNTDKKIERNCDKSMRLAINPEHEESIFENEYLRQRLRLARIHQCKVREIAFKKDENFEGFQGLNNSKAFKIRSKKFQFFGEMLKSRRKNCEVGFLIKGTQEVQPTDGSKTVQL